MRPLALAEKEKVHNIVRQDTHLSSSSSCSETQKHKKPILTSDFETARKTCNFVSKYYKNTSLRGY